MRVLQGTTKAIPIETMRFMLEFPPMQTRQKVVQIKACFGAAKNLCNPWSCEKHKGVQTGMRQRWQVLDGSSRGLSIASMPADRAQANQRSGKGTQTDSSISMRHSCPENLGKHCLYGLHLQLDNEGENSHQCPPLNYMRAQQSQGHHTIDRLETEWGMQEEALDDLWKDVRTNFLLAKRVFGTF